MGKKKKRKINLNIVYFIAFIVFLIILLINTIKKIAPFYFNSITNNSSNTQSDNKEVKDEKVLFKNFPMGFDSDTTLAQNAYFQIYYIKNGNFFLISVIGSPFQNIVPVAEKNFMDILDIDEESACQIDVRITTPRFANSDEAGKVYKLSFCQ